MTKLCEIDGCREGWVAITLDTRDSLLSACVMTTEELAAFDFDLAGIDVPIGLPDSGARRADLVARSVLGARRSSVFPTPIRPALHATCWEEACDITAAVDGRRVSRQTFAILSKIREIDFLLQADSGLHRRLLEVHPEVSFAEWNGSPMADHKKTATGKQKRQELIAQHYGSESFTNLRKKLPVRVSDDDLADAFATLWTVQRVLAETARRLPAEPLLDSAGIPMNMWC